MDGREAKILKLIEADIAANRLILPSLPEVALRVQELASRDDCDYRELEREVSRDAAITARLLKVANSSALHRGQPLTSVHHAIARLGVNLVRSLVTQLCILQTMQSSRDTERLQGFVEAGLRISALCHTLAGQQSHLDPEQAALGGLLHDIGKLPLRRFLERYPRLQENPAVARHLEQNLHPAVGALLLERWSFTPELVAVAAEHETLTRDPRPEADYTDLVIAANLIHYGTDTGRYAQFAGIEIPALAKCGAEAAGEWQNRAAERTEMSLSLAAA